MLKTSDEIDNEINKKIHNEIGMSKVEIPLTDWFYKTCNLIVTIVQRSWRICGHEILPFLFSCCFFLLPTKFCTLLPFFGNEDVRCMIRRVVVADSRVRGVDSILRDWIKTCCGALMRRIDRFSRHSVSKNRTDSPTHFDEAILVGLQWNRKWIAEQDLLIVCKRNKSWQSRICAILIS